jgi:hypothetical protein
MHSVDDDLPQVDGDGADEQWRREVASRLDHYRARRKKKTGANASLSFDFGEAGEPATPRNPRAKTTAESQPGAAPGEPGSSPRPSRPFCDTNFYRRANAEAAMQAADDAEPEAAVGDLSDALYGSATPDAEPAPEISEAERAAVPAAEEGPSSPELQAPEYDPDFDFDRERPPAPAASADGVESPREPEPAAAGAREGKQDGKLIYFPKPAIRLPVEPPMLPVPPYGELAEPVSSPPRIMDVPEAIIPTIEGPLFADISLDSEKTHEESPAAAPSPIELPLPVAFLSQRIFAALVDWLAVLAASALFCLLPWKLLPRLPEGRYALVALAGTVLFFWTIYHYLMLVYGRRTAGMEMANVSLRGFDGQAPTRPQRRRRVYSMLFSLLSLGLGFAWALVDEDSLCWHDRITRTFPTQD